MGEDKSSKNSIGIKLFAITGLAILLLIPTFMIMGLIEERKDRRDEVIREVGSKWGQEQTLIGPILSVPYQKGSADQQYVHFLPSKLNIKGNISPQILQRGIYEVIAYSTNLKFEGEFESPDLSNIDISSNQFFWDRAIVSIVIPDMRGLEEEIRLNWNSQEYLFTQTSEVKLKDNSKISTRVPLPNRANPQQKYSYSFEMKLKGIQALNFIPVGAETNIELESGWNNPSFKGAFLPDEREIRDDGFSANWRVLEVNRSFPQEWVGEFAIKDDSSFGVKLLYPVDEYQKSTRSIKYAILLIALTFLIFFFVEIFNKRRIHPFQYILVGLVLVLFFSLLLSLSEHLNFNLAYLLASVATILAITLYSKNIFKSVKLTLFLGACLIIIYAFIYIIIQLQDYALLVGNVGLFIILVIVMFVSRKVDWYEIGSKDISNKINN